MKDAQANGDGLVRTTMVSAAISAGSCLLFLMVVSFASSAIAHRVTKGSQDDSAGAEAPQGHSPQLAPKGAKAPPHK